MDRDPDRVDPSGPACSRPGLLAGEDGTVRNGNHQLRS